MRAVIYGGNILQDFSRIFHGLRIFQEFFSKNFFPRIFGSTNFPRNFPKNFPRIFQDDIAA